MSDFPSMQEDLYRSRYVFWRWNLLIRHEVSGPRKPSRWKHCTTARSIVKRCVRRMKSLDRKMRYGIQSGGELIRRRLKRMRPARVGIPHGPGVIMSGQISSVAATLAAAAVRKSAWNPRAMFPGATWISVGGKAPSQGRAGNPRIFRVDIAGR